jgi:hypothetical protein
MIGKERSAACAARATESAATHSTGHIAAAKRAGATHVSAKCTAASHASHARSAHAHVAASKRATAHATSKSATWHAAAHPHATHAAHVHAAHPSKVATTHAAEVATPAAEVTSAATHVAAPTAVAASPASMSAPSTTSVPKALARYAEQRCRNQRHTYGDQSFTHDPSPLSGCSPSAPRPTCSPYRNFAQFNRSTTILTAFSRIFRAGVTALRCYRLPGLLKP